jgi:hypothetical protein
VIGDTSRSRLRAPELRALPVYPVIAVAVIVLALFADYGSPWSTLWRPLVVSMLVVLALQMTLTVVTRRRHLAALVTLVAVLAVLFLHLALALVLILEGWFVVLWWRTRPSGSIPRLPLARFTRFANLMAVIALIIGMSNVVASGPYRSPGLGPRPVASTEAPDIYVILLDGHPRLDTLRDQFGVDTAPFQASLTDRGFIEATAAHSNYNLTFLTLASMFNGQQIDTLVPDKPTSGSLGVLHALINDGREIDRFHEAGYEVVSVPSQFSLASLQRVDRYIDTGHLTDFEIELAHTGYLNKVFTDLQRGWLMQDHREQVEATFDALHALAKERADHPRFIFAHVLAPHAPVAFAADGSAVDGLDCLPATCALWSSLYGRSEEHMAKLAGQVEYVDDQVLDVIEDIQDHAARPPVIVLFSDHGLRHDYLDEDESLHSLLIASTPGKLGVFPNDASPVNILRRLSNAYLGTDLALATEESYFIDILRLGMTGAFAYRRVDVAP